MQDETPADVPDKDYLTPDEARQDDTVDDSEIPEDTTPPPNQPDDPTTETTETTGE